MATCASEYVIRVCGRCDLACDHCNNYEHVDQTRQHKPSVMADETVVQTAQRISEHARAHRLARVNVVLYGGDPLLLGHDRLRGLLHTLRSAIDPVTRLNLVLHTNGGQLDEEFCELFARYGVRVSVALDGGLAEDMQWRIANGTGRSVRVPPALTVLNRPEYRYLFAGILCRVDVENDPIAVYEAMLAHKPPQLDLLLPRATMNHQPLVPPGGQAPSSAWLDKLQARWQRDGSRVPIRFFGPRPTAGRGGEAAGLDPIPLVVIATDGGWEKAGPPPTARGGADAAQSEIDGLDGDSMGPARDGGLCVRRYRPGSGFDSRPVYYDRLKALIPRVTAPPGAAAAAIPDPDQTGEAGEQSSPLTLDDTTFDLLAAGPGDRTAMRVLADAMYNVNLALVAKAAQSLDSRTDDRPASVPAKAAVDGWQLLRELKDEYPNAVREALSYPYVQTWATLLLGAPDAADADLRRAHLGGIAATAALLAGVEVEVTVPVLDGALHLPAAGAFVVPPGTGPVAQVRVSPLGVSCPVRDSTWHAVRRIDVAGTSSLVIDDVDPFRDNRAWMVTGRLPDTTGEMYRRALSAAICLLAAELPGYADPLCAGLRTVVPILPSVPGPHLGGPPHGGSAYNGSGWLAYGSAGVTLPDQLQSPEQSTELSEELLQEMQHIKLNGLATMFNLVDRRDNTTFPVPWHAGARTLDDVLHEAYGYLAVADLWRTRGTGPPHDPTIKTYRTYRTWTRDAIALMLDSGGLLPLGERFVTGMRDTVTGWGDDW